MGCQRHLSGKERLTLESDVALHHQLRDETAHLARLCLVGAAVVEDGDVGRAL